MSWLSVGSLRMTPRIPGQRPAGRATASDFAIGSGLEKLAGQLSLGASPSCWDLASGMLLSKIPDHHISTIVSVGSKQLRSLVCHRNPT